MNTSKSDVHKNPEVGREVNEDQREAFKKQAEDLKGEERKQTWQPTWQKLGLSYDRTAIFSNAVKAVSKSSKSSSKPPSS